MSLHDMFRIRDPKILSMVETNPRFKRIKRNAKKMIEVCTRWKFKEEEEEKEDVDMCQALLDVPIEKYDYYRKLLCQ